MGFFDKMKDSLKKIKEDNKYFARTTARINSNNLYGNVNYRPGKVDPNEDFRNLSYVNVENGKGIIYNVADEDYIFAAGDIVAFNLVGDGHGLANGDQKPIPTLRFNVGFKDGKKTTMDISIHKLEAFKATFGL